MSIEDLNAEVERRRCAQQRDGHILKSEQMDTILPFADSPDRVANIAEVMPEVLATLQRTHEKWKARRESYRPEFDAARETVGCEHHPSEIRHKLFDESCSASWSNGYFTAVYAPCAECDGERDKANRRRFWSRRGVPERIVESTLSNFACAIPEQGFALDGVKRWIQTHGVFLVLLGSPGTGKGHLAAGCLKAQGDGKFITHPDLMSDLRASYTLHTTKDLVESWQDCEMLVLDEFGLSPGGKDEEPILYQILADRYDKRRPTIITTNLDLPKFREEVGYRLMDRIKEDCQTVVMRWPSHRSKK